MPDRTAYRTEQRDGPDSVSDRTVRLTGWRDGLLKTYLQEESGGPPRKYYSLTQLGRETFEKDRAEYLLFADSVRNMLEEDGHD